MSSKKQDQSFYLGNKNLPVPETQFEWTAEMVENLERARKSILFFSKYFYIINLDEGKQAIKLYPAQKRVLKALLENRFNIVLSSRQVGKALDINTPIRSTRGWTTMGDIKAGDKVFDEKGNPCNVVKAHAIMHGRKCYKVTFDNGEEIIADQDHLWFTQNRTERQYNRTGSVKTTQQILETLTAGIKRKEPNHRIHVAKAIKGKDLDLPIDPYYQKKIDRQKIANGRSQYHYIKKIEQVESRPVRCITVDSPSSLYLCGKQMIPTHNSTLLTIIALWLICFNDSYSVLLIANKQEAAKNIFKRIKLAYEMLPNYMKPGVVAWAKEGMELANGSTINISTTTSDAGRSSSINCVTGNSLVTVMDKETGEIKKINMSDLADELRFINKKIDAKIIME